MIPGAVVALALTLAPTLVYARSIRMNSCVVTIGSFCPVETVGGILLTVALFLVAGWPLRKLIEAHVRARAVEDERYVPGPGVRFLHANAGYLSLAGVGLGIFAIVSA